METILNIINQRHNHRLPEWQQFCKYCLNEIPYLKEFYTAMTNDTDFN